MKLEFFCVVSRLELELLNKDFFYLIMYFWVLVVVVISFKVFTKKQ